MYELTVKIDEDGPLASGVQYSNGGGNLVVTGYDDVIEEIRFVRHPDQKDFWKFVDFRSVVRSGPATIGGKPVIELVAVEDHLITVRDRLGEYGRYKYTIEIESSKKYVSDPEIQNRRDVGTGG